MPALRHSVRSRSLALAVMATMGTCTPISLSACPAKQPCISDAQTSLVVSP